jgi:RNA exonuclease NGL2
MPYQLLASRGPYDPKIVQGFEDSRLVHTSVEKVGLPPPPPSAGDDASTSGTGANTPAPSTPAPTEPKAEKGDEGEGEGEGEGELPDSNEKSIANTRAPTEDDGILSLSEVERLAAEVLPQPARSAYASTTWGEETYAARGGLEGIQRAEGGAEPAYTCFTPLFRLTLGE